MRVTLAAYRRGRLRGQFVLARPETVIGRCATCDLRVKDMRVSRQHCRIVIRQGAIKVLDLHSRAGTYLNGQRVEEAALCDGDEVSVGRTCFKVNFTPASYQAPAISSTLPGSVGCTQCVFGSATEQSVAHAPAELLASASGQGCAGPETRFDGEAVMNSADRSLEEVPPEPDPLRDKQPAAKARLADLEQDPQGRSGARPEQPARPANKLSSGPASRQEEPGGEIIPSQAVPVGTAPWSVGGDNTLGFHGVHTQVPAERRRSIRQVIWYRWTIVLVTIAVSGPIIAGVWLLMKPQYQAEGQVRVRPIIPHLVFKTDESGTIPFYQSYVNTQVGVIRSPTVLERALDQLDVQGTRWYRQSAAFWQSKVASELDRLKNDLVVRPRGLTELIDVSIKTEVGKDSAVIVNAVLDQYIKYLGETSNEDSDTMFRQLVKEYNDLERELKSREEIVARLRKQLGTGNPEELVASKRVRLDQTEAHLETLRTSLATARWRQEELQRLLKAKEPTSGAQTSQPANQSNYQDDPEWCRLQAEAQAVRHKVEVSRELLGSEHPKMLALTKDAEFAEKLLLARQAQVDQQLRLTGLAPLAPDNALAGRGQELEALDWQIKSLAYEEKLLADYLVEQRDSWGQAFDGAQVLAKELASIGRKMELHNAVRSRLEQKRMERNVPGSIEILARAAEPSVPASDRRLALTALALLLGLGAGLGTAFLLAGGDPPICQAEELTCVGPAVPFLGQLPRVATRQDHAPLDDPLLKEGIRMVRTPLLQQIDNQPGSIVLITSASPGDGKTTVAAMLARSLAWCGRNVLLVDADLRNPRVCQHLGIDAAGGFLEALTGQVDDSRLIVQTDTPRLSVLPGCHVEAGLDPELIANGAFSAAAARWRGKYDVILVDSPPVLPVADARILARHADGTILVTWAQRTRRADVVDALTYLASAGGRLLGTVFICSPRRGRHGYSSTYNRGAQR